MTTSLVLHGLGAPFKFLTWLGGKEHWVWGEFRCRQTRWLNSDLSPTARQTPRRHPRGGSTVLASSGTGSAAPLHDAVSCPPTSSHRHVTLCAIKLPLADPGAAATGRLCHPAQAPPVYPRTLIRDPMTTCLTTLYGNNSRPRLLARNPWSTPAHQHSNKLEHQRLV